MTTGKILSESEETEVSTNMTTSISKKGKEKSKGKSKSKSKEKGKNKEKGKTKSKSKSKKSKKEDDDDAEVTSRKRKRGEEEEEEDVADTPKKAKKKKKTEEAEEEEDTANGKTERMEVPAFLEKHEISVIIKGGNSPEPFQHFTDAPFGAGVQKQLVSAGFSTPSAIQAQCWPLALTGKDLIAVAKTGSGKTIGFLLPCFHHIAGLVPKGKSKFGGAFGGGTTLSVKRGDGPIGLVLAPTRELACQIEAECTKFGRSSGISAVCVYGGVPKGKQIGALMRGTHMVIATPGRMNDMLNLTGAPATNLDRCSYLVLDEADRMLDMGFEPQIRTIIERIPKDHQTLMFSATWPKAVQQLAQEFLRPDAARVTIGSQKLSVNTSVTQIVHKVGTEDKEEKLAAVLSDIASEDKDGTASVIVFANRKRDCDYLAECIRSTGWGASSIHGDLDQWARTRALERFARRQDRAIVATDVAARGLDIDGVTHVINYDMPPSNNGLEDWVHRVGRTGRAGASGIAHSFFTPSLDRKNAFELVRVLKEAKQDVPTWLDELADRMRPRGGGRGGRGGGRWGGRGSGRGGSWGRGGGSRFGGGRGGRGGSGRGFGKKW